MLLALTVVIGFHLYPRTGVDRVRHVLDWSVCTTVEEHDNVRPDYARRWANVRSQTLLICQNLGPHVYYVRLASSQARVTAIRTSPPDESYCVFGDAELVVYTGVSRSDRERTCGRLDGSLR